MRNLRNIRLIPDYDPAYQEFQRSFRKSEQTDHAKEKSKSEQVAYVLELTTRAWLKESGKLLPERIIAYDVYKRRENKWVTRYSEADYILKRDHTLIVGEIKASYSRKRVLSKAVNQLLSKSQLLRISGCNVKLQILFFDLSGNALSDRSQPFNSNFNQMLFSILSRNNVDFEYLQIDPKEIYAWGTMHGIIKTPELIDFAMKEAETRSEIEITRIRCKKNCRAVEEVPVKIPDKIGCSTQGLCERSRFMPTKTDITRALRAVNEEIFQKDTILIARHNWMKTHFYIIPESAKILNLCIEIKNRTVIRAFFSETLRKIFIKLNYQVIVLN